MMRGSFALGALALLVANACGGGAAAGGQGDAGRDLASAETGGADLSGEDLSPPGEAGALPSRWLTLDGVVNARDLGGYSAAGGQRVRWRALMRAGTLSTITAAGCDSYAGLGVRTLLDLRSVTEVANAPDSACALAPGYENVPFPQLLPPTEENYLAIIRDSGPSVARVFERLSQPGALPALHHCVIGRDRASVVTALVLLALGVAESDVMADFLLSNDAGIAVDRTWVEAVLGEVAARGGIDAYLGSLGVSTAQVDALRASALEPAGA